MICPHCQHNYEHSQYFATDVIDEFWTFILSCRCFGTTERIYGDTFTLDEQNEVRMRLEKTVIRMLDGTDRKG
jgi:hypothetical protein